MRIETLLEEPNTSLMFYKLFPDQRITRQLECYGFTFQMGGGKKNLKTVLSRAHRSRGVHTQRSKQTILILHHGRIFREFTTEKWSSHIDPSDKDSKTHGQAFLEKLLAYVTNQRDKMAQQLNITL